MNNQIKQLQRVRNSSAAITRIVTLLIILTLGIYSCKSDSRSTVATTQPIASFDSLKAAHDSVVAEFNASNIRVDELTSQKATLDSELRKKEAEIARLKNEVKRFDKNDKSLAGKLKKDESFIASIKGDLSEKEKHYAEQLGLLLADKEKLAQQLADLFTKYNKLKELGSVLHASNIRVEPLHLKHNGKEKKTARARRLNVLRVYFDIDENRIAQDGTKQLYLVITGPDGRLLHNGDTGTGSITTDKGNAVSYSIMKEIALVQNEPVKNEYADWKQEGDHEKGVYNIAIYNGGYKIGRGDVTLK